MSTNVSSGTAPGRIEQTLTSAEVEQGKRLLEDARIGAIAATEALSQEQWNFKPAPERWSVAEIVEHMVLTQELVLGPIREFLKTSPPGPADRDHSSIDVLLRAKFVDRTARFQGPEVLRPTGRVQPGVAVDRLSQNTARLCEYLESTPDLRRHVRESPPLKAISMGAHDLMDGYQWVLTAALHTERHTKQILEVKADPLYPAK